jgi:CO dehydrogenase/acetyl-CoA synthase beta subunit
MGLFDTHLSEITKYVIRRRNEGKVSEFFHEGQTNWPSSANQNLVLGLDTAVELGNPKDASTSFLLWNDNRDQATHNRITVVGPDLPQVKEKQISFGKIAIVNGEDFNEENSYDRYQLLDQVRYNIRLNGYMMRSASQYQREWSRVSREAVQNGFSFRLLGGALIDALLKIDFVRSAEVIFITSSKQDVLELKPVSEGVSKLIGAMNKMAEEMSVDCDTCDYSDVCSDVAELRAMRKANKRKKVVHA